MPREHYVTHDNLQDILDGIESKISGCSSSGISPWKANTKYEVGDFLFYTETLYRVNTAFTSGSNFDTTNLDSVGGFPLTSTDIDNIVALFNVG